MEWEVVIGLEIHTQLATQSKIFSGASTQFGSDANTQACAIDLGMPGVLPVINEEAVRMAVLFGHALGANIGQKSVFERKNYFYPDLPKGYQISQADFPIVGTGEVEIHLEDGTTKMIGLTRAHLEEDAGKSLHEDFQGLTGVDLNRAGTPLLEIVSDPDMRSAKEAVSYLKYIHTIIRYLEISDGNMAEGSMRCDANVSIRPKGQEEYGTRTELKNINSFRFVEKAINVEIERQIELVESGGRVEQQTRLYDANKNETRPMRSKEEANDYRYFPDPDLLPIELSDEYIQHIKEQLPELPRAKAKRFVEQHGLNEYDSQVLVASKDLANFFEGAVKASAGDTKLAANWVMVDLMGYLNKNNLDISQSPINASQLGGLLKRISDKTISGKIAKTVFEAMCDGQGNADEIIKKQGGGQVTDSGAIEKLVDDVIANNPIQVEQYRSSDESKQKRLIGFFVGQIMKVSKGKANPQQVNEILKKKL